MLCFRRLCAHWNALLLLLALTCCGEPTRATEPDVVYLRYEVTGGPGLGFLTVQVSLSLAGDRYSLVVDAQTRGLADFFVDLHSRLVASGRISGDMLYPEAMRAETHRRGIDLYARVDYGPGGTVSAQASPAPGPSVRPVIPAQMRGTIDQLSAYLALAHHIASRGSCALALAVFDGRRRYDLSFTDLPPESVPGFAGPAKVCQMWRRRIAGFPVDQGGEQPSDQGKLWFIRLVSVDMLVPVKFEFGSEFGTFTANLAQLRARGVDRRFTE